MSSVSPSSAATSVATLSPNLATAAKLPGRSAKGAREFEANLIASLLESMEKTFATLPGESTLPGADDYNYLGHPGPGRRPCGARWVRHCGNDFPAPARPRRRRTKVRGESVIGG